MTEDYSGRFKEIAENLASAMPGAMKMSSGLGASAVAKEIAENLASAMPGAMKMSSEFTRQRPEVLEAMMPGATKVSSEFAAQFAALQRRELLEAMSPLRNAGRVASMGTLSKQFAAQRDDVAAMRRSLAEVRTVPEVDGLDEWVPPEVGMRDTLDRMAAIAETQIDLLQELVDAQQAENEANDKRSRRTERWVIIGVVSGWLTGIGGAVVMQIII